MVIVGVASYFGLGAIRSFALSIAQENHDANLALDMTEETRRAKRQRDADAAATAAFSKVEPLLPASVVAKGAGGTVAKSATTALPQSAPPSGNSVNITLAKAQNEVDEEATQDESVAAAAEI